ncbi:MAG TPA: peptidylprolyl isomerase [Gammaproteobacteria bacterium]|nr:peptidylprolyl isomerase [Gammaproteobacteria bacterium]
MKVFRVLFLLLAFIGTAAHAKPETPPTQEINRIVAVVNDDVIVQSELDAKIKLVREQLQAQKTPLPAPKVLRRQVLNRLITQHLELQLASKNNITVDDHTLDAAMRRLASQNGMNLTQFRGALERDGYDYKQFRDEIRKQIIIQRLQQRMINDKVQVTSQEVDNELSRMAASGQSHEEYHLAHILVAVPDAASPAQIQAAKRKAEGILQKLHNGADFREMAVAQSDGQQALKGGDLGWRKAGQLPTIFANIVQKMKTGQISGLIRSPSGFHIIKLVAKRGEQQHVVTQTLAREIVIKPNQLMSSAQARKELGKLRQRILDGDDFGALARAHSDDKVTAANGGSLGWVNPGQLPPQFQQVMDKTKVGQISQPFQTRRGWVIVQVLDRRKHDSTKDYRRARARNLVHKRKAEEALNLWLRQLRDDAYVKIEPHDNT